MPLRLFLTGAFLLPIMSLPVTVCLLWKEGIAMTTRKNGRHLTLKDRNVISYGIIDGMPKAAIAREIGVDKSTVGKEIKNNSQIKTPAHYDRSADCKKRFTCPHHYICNRCNDYVQSFCYRRDRSPGACDGCSKIGSCRRFKVRYSANIAQTRSDKRLHESREGLDMTDDEALKKGTLIKKLVNQGQSPYMIITDHPELGMCVKTLYNYIDERAFAKVGLLNIDLRMKSSRRHMPAKTAAKYKKRKDMKYLIGRTYDDEKKYLQKLQNSNKHVSVVEMDTVYNDVTNGPFMQTFKFIDCDVLFAVYHTSKTAADMVSGVDLIENILGKDLFRKVFQILLTDRGTEFSNAEGFEKNGRTRVFYCDPMMAGQKGSLENVHRELRYMLPKETDLLVDGLRSQEDLNLVVSEINSAPKEHLNDVTPYELGKLIEPELMSKLFQFGLQEIPRDEVNLTPDLLKKRH